MSTYDKASLVLIPSGTKEGTIFSQKPTNGDGDFTFSRSTAATRVNASGYIEKETQNLLLQSNQFDTTWTQLNASLTSGQSGYDGSNDAWKLTADSTGTFRRLSQTTNQNSVVTSSVYAKAGTADHLYMIPTNGSYSTGGYQFFNLTNGTLGASNFLKIINASIEDVGNGWYRCTIVSQADVSGMAFFGLSNNDTDTTITGGNYIYIQDAQLEQGLVARDYIETTTSAVYGGITDNIPRLDYTDSSCPSLLLEPQRTNLITQSEYFGSGGWSITNGTLTTNYAISPEGVQNASKINFSSGGEIVRTTSFTAGQAYTFSFYAKAESGTFDFTYGNIDYTLTSGTATTEWQRFEVTQTAPISTRFPKIDATDIGDLLIYGIQLEQGSYATSYIPTYGSAVTRNQDSCSVTGVSDLIGQTEGTLFVDLDNVNELDVPEITLDDGTNDNRIVLTRSFDSYWSLFTSSAGSGSSTLSTLISNNGKFAIAYNSTNYVVYKDGALILTRTASLPVSLSDFRLNGRATGDFYGNKSINQALLFKTRLTNEELAALTTI